jgi:hypothetical protein
MLLLDEEEEEKVEGAELVIGKRPCDRVRINTTLVKMELKPEEEKGIVDGLLDDVEWSGSQNWGQGLNGMSSQNKLGLFWKTVKYSDTKQVNEILILEKGEEEEEQMSSELRNDAAEKLIDL